MGARFFPSAAAWRAWLEAHHAREAELLVGYHKVHTTRPSLTWSQSVDHALCFGWIDGVRRSVDAARYTIRFTPRKPGSAWSAINIEKVEALRKKGLMYPAGEAAFAARLTHRSRIYSYEQRHTAVLRADQDQEFRRHRAAWDFFASQPPGYRNTAIYWVTTAKKEETQTRRLQKLIGFSGNQKRLPHLISPQGR